MESLVKGQKRQWNSADEESYHLASALSMIAVNRSFTEEQRVRAEELQLLLGPVNPVKTSKKSTANRQTDKADARSVDWSRHNRNRFQGALSQHSWGQWRALSVTAGLEKISVDLLAGFAESWLFQVIAVSSVPDKHLEIFRHLSESYSRPFVRDSIVRTEISLTLKSSKVVSGHSVRFKIPNLMKTSNEPLILRILRKLSNSLSLYLETQLTPSEQASVHAPGFIADFVLSLSSASFEAVAEFSVVEIEPTLTESAWISSLDSVLTKIAPKQEQMERVRLFLASDGPLPSLHGHVASWWCVRDDRLLLEHALTEGVGQWDSLVLTETLPKQALTARYGKLVYLFFLESIYV